MRAVQYDRFGGLEVLEVRDIPVPSPGPGEVLVRARAAGINPGESALRRGEMAQRFPSTFPSGQGSDLAGVVTQLGEGVTRWRISDEVLGRVDSRSSHAEYVTVPANQQLARPAGLDGRWPAGCTSPAPRRGPRCAPPARAATKWWRFRAPPAELGASRCSSRWSAARPCWV